MANVPGNLPDGLDPADFGPAIPLVGGAPARQARASSGGLPAGLDPADFGAPVEQYQPVGMDVDGLRSALTRARGVSSPDQVAEVLKLSRQTGLDVGTVERNLPEVKGLAEFDPAQLDAFAQRNPKATAWLRDPVNFGLAKDDLDTLGGVEQAFVRNSAAPAEPEEAGGVGTSLLKTVKRTIPTVGSGLYDMYGLGAGGLDYIERGLGNLLGTGSTGIFGKGRDWFHGQSSLIADNILAQPGLSLPQSKQGRLWDNPRLLLDPEWLTFNVGDAANSMLPTIASLFLSGGATAVPAVIGAGQEAGNLYRQLISEDKADPDKALSAALAFGVVVGQLEKLGLDKIMDKRVASTVARRIAKAAVAGATEGGTEYLEEPFQAFFQGLANNESPEQVTARVADALKNVDVMPGAFLLGGAGAYGNTAHEYRKAKAAQRMGAAFDEIGKLSGESKLNARLPEAYQDYVEYVRRETGGAVPEQIYVSAQRLAEAVVETGANGGAGSVQADAQVLAQFFQSIGVKPEDAQRMAALDQDVAIPFALYQSKIAATDIGQTLANDLRFTHDGMTRNEAAQFEKEFQGRVQSELAAQEQNRVQHDADLAQVIGEYKGELARVGIKGKDADATLQLLSAGANVAAARWSAIKGETVTPAQWLREVRGLQIRAVEQGQARQNADLEQGIAHAGADLSKPEQVTEAKRLWETMGTDSPYFKKWFGDSKVVDAQGKPLVVYHGTGRPGFTQFMRGQGGYVYFTPDQDYANRFAGNTGGVYPSYLSMKKPLDLTHFGDGGVGGLRLRDYLRDKLDIDLSGIEFRPSSVPVYNQVKHDELKWRLEEHGYDGIVVKESGSTAYLAFQPEQIKSATGNRGTFDAGDARILMQSAYHGSPYRFDKFTLDHIGSGEGAQAFGYGLYFAGNKDVAEYYRHNLADIGLPPRPEAFTADGVNYARRGKAEFLKGSGEIISKEEYGAAFRKAQAEYEERVKTKGQLYEVTIPDDHTMLDWDKPLSEQPEGVKKALESSPEVVGANGVPKYSAKRAAGGGYYAVVDVVDADYNTLRPQRIYRDKVFKTYEEASSGAKELFADRSLTGQNIYVSLSKKLGSDRAASEYLKSIGIPGLRYLDGTSRGKGEGHHNYVVFDDAQIAIDRTYYQAGGFFSPTARFVEAIQVKKPQPAKFWIDQLYKGKDPKPGLRPEELEDLGLREWLEGQQGVVSKEQVLQFIKDGGPKLEEVRKGEERNLTVEEAKGILASGGQVYAIPVSEPNSTALATLDDGVTLLPWIVRNPAAVTLREGTADAAHRGDINTKFGQYQLPGGENYREVLVTVPPADPVTTRKQYQLLNADGVAIAAGNEESAARWRERNPQANIREEMVPDNRAEARGDLFTSSHWSEPNVLAHYRLNDRTDAEGNKVLFIEEIQSDWHQKGRREGYASEEAKAAWSAYKLEMRDKYTLGANDKRMTPEDKARGEKIRAAAIATTPNAPFKKSWPMLAFKRILREAVEKGYDSVAWTTGEQQAERYHEALLKEVNSISVAGRTNAVTGEKSKSIHLDTTSGGGVDLGVSNAGVIENARGLDGVKGKPLSEVVGKDLAEKLLNSPSGTKLEGNGLKVGGEGMKGFYDKMLPKMVQDYVKKLDPGAKVGVANIGTPQDTQRAFTVEELPDGSFEVRNQQGESEGRYASRADARAEASALNRSERNTGEKDIPVHSLTITPTMREQIQNGQALYQFLGANAATADKLQLGKAQQMEQQGKSNAQIRKATGWFKGMDGKWRFEIDDSKAKFITPPEGLGYYEDEGENLHVGDVLDHPELFKAYPELADVPVYFANTRQFQAAYSPETGAITISDYANDFKSVLLHELQHAVQEREGFARGGSPYAGIKTVRDVPGWAELEAEKEKLLRGDWTPEIGAQVAALRDQQAVLEKSAGLGLTPDQRYEKTAGEIEARDVQARMGMSEKKRKATAPDLQPDAIVVWGGKETAYSMNSGPRGSITFTDTSTMVKLFKGAANRSTLPHEFAHLFVNDMQAMVATGKAPESVVRDLAALQSFAGDLATTEAQEKLAPAFEAYLREGKAPSPELRSAFQKFAAWLTAIYRDIRALIGPDGINDELRGVFDRMLASEEEITQAEAYYGARDALENVAADMLTDAEKGRIVELRGQSHADAFEKRVKRYVAAYIKALGGKGAFEAEARAEVEAMPAYAAADEAVMSGGLSYADVAMELGGVALIPELNRRRPGLVRDNYAFNAQLKKRHETAVNALRKSEKKDVADQRRFLTGFFEDGLKNNTAWRIKSFLLYGVDPVGEHSGGVTAPMRDKVTGRVVSGRFGLDYDDAVYHWGKEGIEGVQIGLVRKGGKRLDQLMQEWGVDDPDVVRDALHFNRSRAREAFVESGVAELQQSMPEFKRDGSVGVTIPELLAIKHGFQSAEHMLMEILRSQNKGDAIKALVDKKLAAKEQELRGKLSGETVPGDEDVHSDATLERLTMEAKALERKIKADAGARAAVSSPINAAASREVARAVLEATTVADARDYSRFAAAERRAGLEVARALKAQDWQKALAAKQREAVNHALVLEAVKLREEVTKEIAFAKRIGNSKSMRFEAKEQALSVIQAYGLGTEKMRPERPAELTELAEYLKAAFEGDLFNPFDAFPDWLLRKEKAGQYRNLSVADFREVAYLMRSLADIGGSAAVHMATEDVSYEAKATELSEVIRNSGNVAAKHDEGTKQQKAAHLFRSLMSTMQQQLDMFRKADGYVNLGPESSHLVGPNQALFERIQQATKRMLGMQQELEPAMREVAAVRQAFVDRFRKAYGERVAELNGVAVPQIMQANERYSWTAERIWTIARNIGNGGNRRCLIEGLGLEWSEIQQLLRVLTKDELLAVQREGKIIGSHYAEADKTFRQVYHRPMAQRITYQPMTIQAADGPVQLDGWYFPIKPDAKLNQRAGDREGADIMKAEASSSAFPPNPRKSFTNARTGAAVPVALSFDVFERGIAEQTRFIALAPILKDADRVFRQEEYRRAYTDAFGREAYNEIRPWLKNIATPGMEQPDAYDDILSKARRGATAFILIGNLKSALKQELGHLPAMKEMGLAWALRGMKALAVDGEMTVEAINAMDPRMKNREKGFDTEQRELLAKARNETVKLAFGKIDTRVTERDVLRFGLTLQRLFDRHTTYSVWAGAFLKGRDGLGMSEPEAIDYAYRMVERTQVTNTDAAMNAIQRGKSWVRLFSMFMSEALPKGSRIRVDFNAFKAGKIGAGEYARAVFYELIGPVLFNVVGLNLLISVAPDEPEEYFWAFWNELFGTIPLLGGVSGFYLYGRGPAESAAFTGMEMQLKAAQKAFNLAQDFEDESKQAALFKALIDVAAYKYRVGNVRRFYETAAEGFEDMADGETKNPFRLVIRKPKGHE